MRFATLKDKLRGQETHASYSISALDAGSISRFFLLVFCAALGPFGYAQSLTDGRPELAFDLELAAGVYTVNIQDLNFPAPLVDLDAAVIEQTKVLAQADEPGAFEFTSSGEPVRLQIFATPDSEQSVGTLSVEVRNVSDEVVLSEVGTVDNETIPGPTVSREYPLSLSEPQNLNVALNDLLIPQGFDSLGAFFVLAAVASCWVKFSPVKTFHLRCLRATTVCWLLLKRCPPS